jgi:hypothetical protein
MKKQKTSLPPAVMNLDHGEELAGMWVTPHIPGTGMYKIIAKKRKDGVIEWAHFVQRDSGLRENVMRGEANGAAQLNEVVEIGSRNLRKFFGPACFFIPAEAEIYTPDGKKAPPHRQ